MVGAMRSLTILGSTGSIGRQALRLVDMHPDRFSVVALTAHQNENLLFEQVAKHRPKVAALTAGEHPVPDKLRFCEWAFGPSALAWVTANVPSDDVLAAVVGMVGLESALAALGTGKRLLLANKEALVAGGSIVMQAAAASSAPQPALLPVDSEHSAIFQCLQAAQGNAYAKLILTASGGPFLRWPLEQMRHATVEEALKHPNWCMGAKISIDSATMFNKALEIIEAKWLFGAQPAQIEAVIHPQSIVHSMVMFQDGAVLAQLGEPDMRVPILYAMAYPDRLNTGAPQLDLAAIGSLQFEVPDTARFPALNMADEALRAGGASGCVLNAANEVAVQAFIDRRIRFGDISDVVAETMQRLGSMPADTLEMVLAADQAARVAAKDIVRCRCNR
jgi:1-deoxy-D-xylulose-5-phosphate reductoisomerase